MKDKDVARFTIRIPIELNEKIEEEARKLGVTRNSYIVMKLQDKLKK